MSFVGVHHTADRQGNFTDNHPTVFRSIAISSSLKHQSAACDCLVVARDCHRHGKKLTYLSFENDMRQKCHPIRDFAPWGAHGKDPPLFRWWWWWWGADFPDSRQTELIEDTPPDAAAPFGRTRFLPAQSVHLFVIPSAWHLLGSSPRLPPATNDHSP